MISENYSRTNERLQLRSSIILLLATAAIAMVLRIGLFCLTLFNVITTLWFIDWLAIIIISSLTYDYMRFG